MSRFLLLSLSALVLTGAAPAETRFDISLSAALAPIRNAAIPDHPIGRNPILR